MRRATITGWGSYIPPAVVTNTDLETLMDTSDEWIASRTGIKERRISHMETSEMATIAGSRALAAAGVSATDIDLVLVATCTPDRLIPAAASYVQRSLHAGNAAAFDLNAACSGFVYGLSVAQGMISNGSLSRVLLIGAEKLTSVIDTGDRTTSVLFGDGAGAVVLEATDGADGILSLNLGADGSLADSLTISGFGTEALIMFEDQYKLTMDGAEIFRNAVVNMGASAAQAVSDAGLELGDVDVLIPHQANVRIIDATARRMGLPAERVFTNIAGYGNTSAASIPIALTEALTEGRVRPGDVIVFVAFGGGLTWGSVCMRFGDRVTPLGEPEHDYAADIAPSDKTGLELLVARQHERRSRRAMP